MRLFHRPISTRERIAIEAAAVERYRRHVDVPRLSAELRELRDLVEELADCLHSEWGQLPAETRQRAARLVGLPSVRQVTPMVMTPDGQFATVGGS